MLELHAPSFSSSQSPGARRRVARVVILLLVVSFFALACTTAHTPRQVDQQLRSVASDVRKPRQPKPRVFAIHAETKMEAWTLLAEARAEPRDGLSRDLAAQLEVGKTRRIQFVVGGAHGASNQQILANALAYHAGTRLPGLTVHYISPEPPGPALLDLARERKARVLHKPLH